MPSRGSMLNLRTEPYCYSGLHITTNRGWKQSQENITLVTLKNYSTKDDCKMKWCFVPLYCGFIWFCLMQIFPFWFQQPPRFQLLVHVLLGAAALVMLNVLFLSLLLKEKSLFGKQKIRILLLYLKENEVQMKTWTTPQK